MKGGYLKYGAMRECLTVRGLSGSLYVIIHEHRGVHSEVQADP